MSHRRELCQVTIHGSSRVRSVDRFDRAQDSALCFDELIMVLDEIAEVPSAPEARFEDFDPIATDTIRLLEYARIRRLHPRIRIERESAATAIVDELLEETGATVVIPLDAAVGSDEDLRMIRLAEHVAGRGRPVEIETVLRTWDAPMLPRMAAFITASGFEVWSIDFLGAPEQRRGVLSSRDVRRTFEVLEPLTGRMKATIRVREAPSFVRYLSERLDAERDGETTRVVVMTSRSSLHVSADGVVSPGRSLPIPVGDVRRSEFASIERHSDLLTVLRDPRLLRGRCGVCEFQKICGGSRARAWRVTRDLLAEDPGCFRARETGLARVHPVIPALSHPV